MSIENISLRKRLGLELYRLRKKKAVKEHTLTYLMWECTLRCNLACLHCGSDCRKDMTQKDMPLADFLRVIDSITPHVDTHRTMIVITGGEPLVRPDLEQCGRELYKREYPWGIVSNGLALTEKRYRSLVEAGIGAITISLDGLENDHNKMRGNSNSFKNAINAIKLLVNNEDGVIYDVVTCVSQHTINQLSQIKEYLINIGVQNWRIATIFPIGRAETNSDLQLKPSQFRDLFEFIKETRLEGKINLNYGCEGFLGNYESEVRDNFFFCRAGVNVGSILVDGSISACPDLRAKFIQGNIYKDDFMTVWNNGYKPYRDRSWTKADECGDCKYFRYCEGNGMHLHDENGKLMFCHLKRIKQGESHL